MERLTAYVGRSIRFFYEDKEDIRGWVGFEDYEEALKEEYPELFEAERILKSAQRIMDAVVDQVTECIEVGYPDE